MRRCLASLILVAICVMFAQGCPPICPECEAFTNIFLTEYHPELGTVTKLCVQGRCDLLPWCFEVFAILIKRILPFPYVYEERLLDRLFVNEKNVEFLTPRGMSAFVHNGVATVCVERGYEIAIPLPGIGKNGWRMGNYKGPVGRIEGTCLYGKVSMRFRNSSTSYY